MRRRSQRSSRNFGRCSQDSAFSHRCVRCEFRSDLLLPTKATVRDSEDMRIPLLAAVGVFYLAGGADLVRGQGNYNGGPAGAKTPEEERATFQVPEGFEVQLVAAESEGIGKFV